MSILAALLLASGAGLPDDTPVLPTSLSASEQAQEKKWRFDIALYLWMADLEGDFMIGPVTGEADADFSDLFDHLKVAGTLHFEAWNKDHVGILADLNYMSFEDESDLGPGPLDMTVTSSVLMAEVAAGFRSKADEAFVDLLAGVRFIGLDNEVEISGTPKESEAHTYLDPMVGVRFGWEAMEWLLLTFRADVGGFGVGTDIEGSMTALAAFRLSPMFAVAAGYRWFALEVADDDSSIDLRMKGPMIAFDIGF